ncbi:MAG: hypothetical protein IKN33_04895 [Selenomonadaceae bacterium]|nr:hypothetical protein [Selenomonadaceae bacterium]
MKKWIMMLLALSIFVLGASPASAEKYDWQDENYQFSKVKRVWVEDIVLTDTNEFPSEILNKLLPEEYWKNANRLEEKLFTGKNTLSVKLDDPKPLSDVYVTAELLKWHDDSYIKPAYTSWETRRSTRTVRRSDGSTYEEEYHTTVPVYHPEQLIYTSTVQVRFDVYDTKTGAKILTRDELRLRDDSRQGQRGIFGRICKSFFDDLRKKLKNEE